MVLNGQHQLCCRLVKLTFEQISVTQRDQGLTHSLARAQPQRSLDMRDREIGLAGPHPENAAAKPAAREARIERQCTVYQRDHGVDILAESRLHLCGIGKGPWVVLRDLQRLPRKVDGLAAASLRCFSPTVIYQPHLADRRPGERRPVMLIDRDRLLEQAKRLE